jgi:thioredoxin-related protein
VLGNMKGGSMKIRLSLVLLAFISGVMGCSAEAPKSEGSAAVKAVVAEKTVWLTSLSEAKAEAARRNVPILADFSGSDWCGWCIKLDKEVFSTDVFKKYAAENLVLLLVDFPRSKPQSAEIKKQNNDLAEKFGIQGFPTILLLDAEGKLLERTSYLAGGGENYVTHLRKLLKNKRN